ncbi:MAG: OmpA family protein [Flavobacteriales bacterium]|nr:OmpA family protein [Flavobacteriales bacterium]
MKTKVILLGLMLGIGSMTYAQKDHYKDAELAFYNEKYTAALDGYKKAVVKVKSAQQKGEINFKIALCYAQMLDIDQAEVYLERADKLKYSSNEPQLVLQMAEVLMQQGDYKKASVLFQQYLDLMPEDNWSKTKLESCHNQISHPMLPEESKYIFQQEIQLNTEYYDYTASFYDKKKNTMLFASTRPGSTGSSLDDRTGESFSDIWMSTRDNKGKWGEPILLPEQINSEHNEGTPVMSTKEDILYFTRCNVIPKKNIGCSIYFSELKGSRWSESQEIKLKPEGGDSISCGHPTLNKSADLLIFAADLPNGFGGKDLWMTRFDKKEKTWGTPINLGPDINTVGDEVFPYLDDENNLYYSSNGLIGLGGLDIYKAAATSDKEIWSKAEILPAPLNSSRDDFGILLENENRGFLTSNRSGGKGGDDLYSFNLKQIKITSECYIVSKEDGKPIPFANIKLTSSDQEIYNVTADADGYFKFDELNTMKRYLEQEKNYAFIASAPEYADASSKITTIGLETSKNFIEEFVLYPKDKPIDLPEVRYDYDDSLLQVISGQVNSKDSLNELYDLMMEHPTWIVELQAHTDCRGPEKYNLILSQGRANECVKYLVSKGIEIERLVPVGYGEGVPRDELTCEYIGALPTKEEQEIAHQKNRRTQFKILSVDYKPKGN